jgi:hypothetical protein
MPNASGELDSNGSGLPHARRLEASDGVVRDRVTGLDWQRAPAEAGSTSQAVAMCEALVQGARDDWRLPTRVELVSLVDATRSAPAFDADAFGGETFSGALATATPAAGRTDAWWTVDVALGTSSTGTPTLARCVRGPRAPGPSPLSVTGRGGLVVDASTGLTWQRALSPARSWSDARDACRTMSAGAWRLPTVGELLTTVDSSRRAPALDASLFPVDGVTATCVWTGSAVASAPDDAAWAVLLESGASDSMALGEACAVRCVR